MKDYGTRRSRLDEFEHVEYSARITRQRDGVYLVEFPDLSGCLTEGNDLEDALRQAREALSGWLFVAVKRGEDLPTPKDYRGRSYYRIGPDIDVAIPLLILRARKQRGLTQQQVAKAIGTTQQAYRKLEIPGKCNPTVRTLARLADVLDLRFTLRAA